MHNRNRPLLAMMTVAILLSGCSEEEDRPGTGDAVACFNNAEPVFQTHDSWVVSSNLNRSQGDDILKGMQPDATASDITETGAALELYLVDRFREILGFEGEPAAVTSYRNPLDFIEDVIAEDEVFNFINGRQMVSGCAQTDTPIRYNNQKVIFSNADGSSTLFYLVDYNYSGGTGADGNHHITRILQEYSQSDQNLDDNPGEATTLASNTSTSLTTYNTNSFTANGYMRPSSVFANWNESKSSLTILKDYDTKYADSVEYINPDGFTVTESLGQIKRLKLNVGYQTGIVELFTSDFKTAYSVIDINDQVTDIILYDVTDAELLTLFKDNSDWKAVIPYRDPGYDGETPTPLTTYTGTLLPSRG